MYCIFSYMRRSRNCENIIKVSELLRSIYKNKVSLLGFFLSNFVYFDF